MNKHFYKCRFKDCSEIYTRLGDLKRHLQAEHALTPFHAQRKLYDWDYEDIEGTEVKIEIDKETLKQMKKDIEKIMGVL